MLVTPFGRRLKRLRIDAGLTVRDLAARTGKSAAYIAKIEVRGAIPTVDLIRKLADALSVDDGDLLNLAKEVRLARAAEGVERRYEPSGQGSTELPLNGGRKLAPVISLINMKGGVGKTTIAAQLAHAADSLDLRTLAVDLDPQSNLSQVLMGASDYADLIGTYKPTVVDIFDNAIRSADKDPIHIDDVIIEKVGYWKDSTLDLIPSQLELSNVLKNPHGRVKKLSRALREIQDRYDLIIIDCAPTDSILTEAAYHASDYLVVPIKPEFMATIGLPLLARSMEQFHTDNEDSSVEIAGLVFNHSSSYSLGPEGQQSIAEVTAEAEKHDWHIFSHQVPYSAAFSKSAREQTPLRYTSYARSDVVNRFKRLANEIFERVGITSVAA